MNYNVTYCLFLSIEDTIHVDPTRYPPVKASILGKHQKRGWAHGKLFRRIVEKNVNRAVQRDFSIGGCTSGGSIVNKIVSSN